VEASCGLPNQKANNMKIEYIYSDQKELQWVVLEVGGVLHATADIRTKYGKNEIESVVVSDITIADKNPHIKELDSLLKIGYYKIEDDVVVSISTNKSNGYTYVLFNTL
jgi:hypothetical protein